MGKIDRFTGKYAFLSNMYRCRVTFDNMDFPSAEHAFQAAKTEDRSLRTIFQKLTTPAVAKHFGQTVRIRSDWEYTKFFHMWRVVSAKFFTNPDLARQLQETYPAWLEEGNDWGDRTWGTVDGEGQNWLGIILMITRGALNFAGSQRT